MNLIRTQGGEELVILSRQEYDDLVAGGISPEEDAAEEAWAQRVLDEANARLASGEDIMLPESVWEAIEGGASPVRALREHRGLSQAELAARAGIPQSYLSTIETGRKPGSARTLSRLAAALGAPLSLLVGE